MECTEGELGTGFTDRLRGDDSDSLAFLNETVVCKISAVALGANAFLGLTGEY